jgi:hypothetical protein
MTVRESLEGTYVLNDSIFLVVCLFDKETVVLYRSRSAPSGGCGVLGEQQHRNEKEEDGSKPHGTLLNENEFQFQLEDRRFTCS